MVSFDVIFFVLPLYVLWVYFISPLKIFILDGCWFCKRKIHANRFRHGLGHGIQSEKKMHTNRFRCGLGHGIQSGKKINIFRALAHPRGPRCHKGCGIRCLASYVQKGLWSSCQNNCLQSCSALSNIHHSLLLRARHDSKCNCFSSSVSIQVVMSCKWQTCCRHTHRLVQSVVHPSCAACIWWIMSGSTPVFIETNPASNTEPSMVACFLLSQLISAVFKNMKYLVHDLLATLYPACSLSTHIRRSKDFSLGSGALGGIASVTSP